MLIAMVLAAAVSGAGPACLSAADAAVLESASHTAQDIANDAKTRASRDRAGLQALVRAHVSTDAILGDPENDDSNAQMWGGWAHAMRAALAASRRCK